MKQSIFLSVTFAILSGTASASEELCSALADTALYADAGLSAEVRPIFQFDGAQFVPSAKKGEAMFGMAYDMRMQPMLEESSYARSSDWICEVLPSGNSDGTALATDELVFDVSKQACQQDLTDTRVTFSNASIGFYEASCDITGEEAGENGVRILSLQCYGEGEEWPVIATITPLDAGGIEMKSDEHAQTYVPCG